MHTKVKKTLKPFLNSENKIVFDLPYKAKSYYNLLIKKIKQRTYNERYWRNIFKDIPLWVDTWSRRVKAQSVKKLADFHFKLLHKILPSQENLFRWKISNSNQCRFGCPTVESYDHMFISCHRLDNIRTKVESIFRMFHFDLKISYKILIFGYKSKYEAYNNVNTVLSHLFYAIYSYWLHNDISKCMDNWIYNELKKWKHLYEEMGMKNYSKILSFFISKW